MAYQYPERMMQELGRKKRENEMARALRYIREIDAKFVVPAAGPPCFLDDHLFDFNDFDRDPTNTFPDQATFIEYMHAHDRKNGLLAIPNSVITLKHDHCVVEHPLPDTQIQDIFHNKRAYLEQYKARRQPAIDAEKASWPRGKVDILTALQEWFEPLMEMADLTAVGINGRVLIDCAVQQIVLDFHTRKVYAWKNEEWNYRFEIDHALLEYCILHHEEDWINLLFLSCRFQAERKGAYNEYVYNFFKCLTSERLQYAEGYYSEKADVKQLWESNGYRIQRRCPHLKADLAHFSKIENGILTCTMHGWQFDLATGRCLTSEGHPLYAQPIEQKNRIEEPLVSGVETDHEESNGLTGEGGEKKSDAFVRTKCDHCWYQEKDVQSSKH